jgi:hypothetical protein
VKAWINEKDNKLVLETGNDLFYFGTHLADVLSTNMVDEAATLKFDSSLGIIFTPFQAATFGLTLTIR